MPNWCNNNLTLTHSDPQMIRRAVQAINDGRLFQEFVPCPSALLDTTAGSHGDPEKQAELEILEEANQHAYGFKNWFDWCVANWGTKWDIADAFITDQTTDHVSAAFDTAWAPPISVYRELEALGFEVDATYHEPGMLFVGRYMAGDDEYYEYGSETADTVREFIGAELDDAYDISNSMREWEEEQE